MTKQSTQADDSVQLPDRQTYPSAMRLPVWVSFVVILGVILLASGAAISKVAPTMLTNGVPMTGAAAPNGLAFSRRERAAQEGIKKQRSRARSGRTATPCWAHIEQRARSPNY